jgi:hypothetical protein
MADPSPRPDSRPPGAPRWVKVSAIVAAVVVVLIVVVALVSGGEHGPGRHQRGGVTPGNHIPPVAHSP